MNELIIGGERVGGGHALLSCTLKYSPIRTGSVQRRRRALTCEAEAN